MHAVQLVAEALSLDEAPLPPEAHHDTLRVATCCVTGAVMDCVPRQAILTRSFTAQETFRAPSSSWISIAAVRVLQYRPARASSWWCAGGVFVPLQRVDVRERVLEQPSTKGPWVGYATTSYKKHGALRAPVNDGSRRCVWQFEETRADVAPMLIADMWPRLRAMQNAGWPRPVLEDLQPSAGLMRKLGMRDWLPFEAWARPRYQSGTYRFLCYLLPSRDELAQVAPAEKAPAPDTQAALSSCIT